MSDVMSINTPMKPLGTTNKVQHGIQNKALRSVYPTELCEHIVGICERYFDIKPLPWTIGKMIKQPTLFDNGD